MKKVLIGLIVLLIITIGCKKAPAPSKSESFILGYWEITKLTIGGIDTLNSLKSDSACFPELHFFYGFNDVEEIETQPGFNIPDSIFYCFNIGVWSFTGKSLNIIMNSGGLQIGPFLSDQMINWRVIGESENELFLFVNFDSQDCYLNIRKKY